MRRFIFLSIFVYSSPYMPIQENLHDYLMGRENPLLQYAIQTETLTCFRVSETLGFNESGELAMTTLLSGASMIRPVLKGKTIETTNLNCVTGGPTDNAHRAIDSLAAHAFLFALNRSRLRDTLAFRIEEDHEFRVLKAGTQHVIAILDPLDETSKIEKGMRYQTTGIAIYSLDGDLVAGGIASLVDQTILFYTKAGLRLSDFDEETKQLTRKDITLDRKRGLQDIRYSMLSKRLTDREFPPTQYFLDHPPIIDTFGGMGVLQILSGELDATIDPWKGQPPYEAYIWSPLAEKSGLIVVDARTGSKIDWERRIPAYYRGEPWASERIPLIIAKNMETAMHLVAHANA